MRILKESKYCLYFHINTTNKEIFYVGIGNNRRPYDSIRRSEFWKNITGKYDYTVQIIETDLTWEKACFLEKEWIQKIGRRDLKKGTLVNLTDGGDGNNNFSDETKNKISKTKTGKRVDSNVKDLSGKIFGKLTVLNREENYSKKTMWLCNCECGKVNLVVRGEHLKEGKKKSCGCILRNSENSKANKPVLQLDKNTGAILSVFKSIVIASKKTNISKAIIHHFLRGKSKSGGGYNWKKIDKSEYAKHLEAL